ncbi:hypothetical protein V6N11_056519 [Hibiscus sabdariffa]|uniref:Uncharacterized protein n=1 Tax=Hibiscus sabdariffa TaxID=183260 RepID=A0ABR2T430_9ROSI
MSPKPSPKTHGTTPSLERAGQIQDSEEPTRGYLIYISNVGYISSYSAIQTHQATDDCRRLLQFTLLSSASGLFFLSCSIKILA